MSIEDLINNITDENFSRAEVTLNDLLMDKMSDAIEQEKIAVANQIFNGGDDEDQLELDLDDEDLDDEDEEDFEEED